MRPLVREELRIRIEQVAPVRGRPEVNAGRIAGAVNDALVAVPVEMPPIGTHAERGQFGIGIKEAVGLDHRYHLLGVRRVHDRFRTHRSDHLNRRSRHVLDRALGDLPNFLNRSGEIITRQRPAVDVDLAAIRNDIRLHATFNQVHGRR